MWEAAAELLWRRASVHSGRADVPVRCEVRVSAAEHDAPKHHRQPPDLSRRNQRGDGGVEKLRDGGLVELRGVLLCVAAVALELGERADELAEDSVH